MTTVGYGDVYPKSYGGRLLGAIMCLWGVLLVSLFVVTITDTLEFDTCETNSYTLIQRLEYRENLRDEAARVISSMYKLKLITRHLGERMSGNKMLDSKSDQRKIENADFEFRRALLSFGKINQESRKFENSTELVFLFKNVDDIAEELEKVQEKQKELKRNQVKIFASVKLL